MVEQARRHLQPVSADGVLPERDENMDRASKTLMKRTIAVMAVVLTLAGPTAQALDAAKGQKVFKKCRACHMVGEKAKNRIGPSLNYIVGRKAAAVEKFKYSPAMKTAATDGLIWTEEALDQYLANPRKMVPQTRMAFRGIPKPADRKNLIAYLKSASSAK
jgi:cytochrome c2